MIAFHGKQSIKDEYVARVKEHGAADEIIKGVYWQHGKGCAVGCTVHSNSHKAYELELGIPRVLARIEDGIFEGLENTKAKEFPLRFLNAVSVGADLSGVADKFLYWLLVDEKNGVINFARTDNARTAIQAVGKLYARRINGEQVSMEEWKGVRAYAAADADDAADAAAYAAAYAADADADDAADAAAYAAAYAADAAAYAADADADDADADDADDAADAAAYVKQKMRAKQADKLIAILKETK